MKIKWWLCILWRVFSLSIAISTSGIYGSPSVSRPVGRRKILKLGTSQGVGDLLTAHLSSTANRKSSPRIHSHSISFRTPQLTQELKPAPARIYSSPPPQIQRPMLLDKPVPKSQRDFTPLPDVSVTCSSGDFVVRVKRNFYGFDADTDELTLGSTCKSNGVLMPYGDLLFSYPLVECDGKRQMPPGYLIYTFVLHYTPLTRFPRRAHRFNVQVECRFQRYHHVYQLVVRPTWETPTVLKKLKGRVNFRIQLMDDTWAMPAKSQVYMLGQTINIQVSALHLPHGGKLFINYCYATTSKDSKTYLKFTVIDNFGCMLESQKNPGGSQFVSPRTDDTLRFFLSAFQFTSDPDKPVFLHCKLHVTSEETGPMHKSCTYRENRWKAVMGEDSICDCCDSKCVTPKPRRSMVEGFASSGALLLLDQPSAPKGGFPPVSPSLVEDVVWFETKMDEFDNPDDLLETIDVEKYRDKEEQSYTRSTEKEKQHIEEDESVPLEGEESEVVQTVFRKGEIFEGTQGLGVRDSELIRGEGSGFRAEGTGLRLEFPWERAELRERNPWESKGSVLTEEEGSIERQWMHPQEESSLGLGMGGKSISQEEVVSQSMKEWGFGVGEEQPLVIPEDEGKEGRVESGETDEDDKKFPLFSETGEEIISDYDGLVESGIDGGKDLPRVWHFKWR
ncbi:uncharacterized protein LOC129811578 [Salvelinus fontinalis]|uniref:uncharacterized protein LOC129811578 n=1 Tax=Salvelinus fontinalis TaxID=8038 RepID=UPI0024856796|nr:uncharacterized protein LOC129811578 [Salvelinus fontinalis]